MLLNGPERYNLKFDSERYEVVSSAGKTGFSGKAAMPGPKLYIVSTEGWPIYIGVTRQRMSSRFRLGWKATGANGYHGYEWRHKIGEANLDVWALSEGAAGDAQKYLETIEAEIVFLIRQAGQWPRYQTEIHFHDSSEGHRDTAKMILGAYRPDTENI